MCRSKAIADISDNNSDVTSSTGELSFLDTISSEVAVANEGSQPWTVLDLNSSQTEFKIDTGADIIVIPETVYNESRDEPLSSPDRILRSPSRHSLKVLEKFLGTLQKSQCKTQEQIYIVKELQKALLGRPGIESLGLLIRVDAVLSSKSAVVSKFPQLFTGLACMEGAYHIDLQSHAKPFSLTAP